MSRNRILYHLRRNWALALPVCFSQLGHILTGVTDNIMVGRIGTIPLAAGSLGNGIFSVILVMCIGFAYGMTPLVAGADGAGQNQKIGSYLRHGLALNMMVGLAAVLVFLVAAPLIHHLDQEEEVANLAQPYFMTLVVSILPLMFFQTFKQFIEGLGYTRQAMYITLLANLVNIGLNYCLIYGKLGFPAWGLFGAGIATLFSRIFMALTMFMFVYYRADFERYWVDFRQTVFQWTRTGEISKIGIPVGLQFFFEVGAFSGAAVLIGQIGASELAAHQIAISLASVTYMFASGISAAATIRVGNYLGKKDIRNLKLSGIVSFFMSGGFMLCCGILFLILKNTLPGFYVNDVAVEEIATSLIVIAAFFQLSDGIQVVGLGTLRGLKDVKIPTAITLAAYWVIALPMGYWLGVKMEMGAEGIWYGLLTGLSVAAIFLYRRFIKLSSRLGF